MCWILWSKPSSQIEHRSSLQIRKAVIVVRREGQGTINTNPEKGQMYLTTFSTFKELWMNLKEMKRMRSERHPPYWIIEELEKKKKPLLYGLKILLAAAELWANAGFCSYAETLGNSPPGICVETRGGGETGSCSRNLRELRMEVEHFNPEPGKWGGHSLSLLS